MLQRHHKQNGFTLLEVLLVISVIALLSGLAIPFLSAVQKRTDIDLAVGTTVRLHRRAQQLSQGMQGDSSWGVRVQSGSITLFKGLSYAARDASLDEVFQLSPSIVPTGVQEIVYAKFTGFPQATGTLILTAGSDETRTVSVQSKGTISY